MNLSAITAARAQAHARATSILNGGTAWSAASQADFDAALGHVEALDRVIARAHRHLGTSAGTPGGEAEALRLFDVFTRVGFEGASADDRTRIRNTMSTTTGSEGGFTVPSLVVDGLIDAIKDASGLLRAATVIPTSTGAAMTYPGSDGTAEVGERVAQNATATSADPAFVGADLATSRYSSKTVAVPLELLQDSAIDVAAFLNVRLGTRMGRAFNVDATVGTGSSQPTGIVGRATSGKVGTTGQTLTIIYDDLVDMIHAVDAGYRSRASFMTNDTLLRVIRKLKDASGAPILAPSPIDGVDRLLGYPVIVNPDMPAPAANAKSLVFGDLSRYVVRIGLDVLLFRFNDSGFAKLGQVGFLAFARMGGNLTDTSAVKFYAHSAT